MIKRTGRHHVGKCKVCCTVCMNVYSYGTDPDPRSYCTSQVWDPTRRMYLVVYIICLTVLNQFTTGTTTSLHLPWSEPLIPTLSSNSVIIKVQGAKGHYWLDKKRTSFWGQSRYPLVDSSSLEWRRMVNVLYSFALL